MPLGQAQSGEAAVLARLAKPVKLPATASESTDTKPEANPYPFRLRNTHSPIGELVRNEKAVLLRNALIDTSLGFGLDIPETLKAGDDPQT